MQHQLGVLSVTTTLTVLLLGVDGIDKIYHGYGYDVRVAENVVHEIDPNCYDEFTLCPTWAKKGLCCDQFYFDKCQLSCTTCGPGPQPCNISGRIYPSGSIFQKNCMSFYCKAGELYTSNKYNSECGTCLIQNDPHFFSYHDVKFDWHGHDMYVLSQKGFDNCSEEYVNALFSDCDVGLTWVTCLDTIYFQPQPDTTITIVKADDIYNSLVTVNGVINNIAAQEDGKLHILDGAVDSEFPVFAWFNDNCLHFMGSKDNGFLIKLCSWSLKIFAHPEFSNNLSGLCGNWDKDSMRYSKVSQHVWDADICTDVGSELGGTKRDVTLDRCKNMCDDTTSQLEEPCNAILYKHNDCVLLRCPLPIPDPTVIDLEYLGYVKGGIDKLTLRNGTVIIPPKTDSFFSNWNNMNIEEIYGHDWQVICERETNATVLQIVDPNPCDVNETKQNEISQICEAAVMEIITTGLSDLKIAAIKADCSFDQCIAKRAANDTLAMAWLEEVKILVQREVLEKHNTVEYIHDPCFVGDKQYSSGTKWEDNCMSFYCEKGLFYTTNKYNSYCSACTVKNDPHFETFDGVLYDWHGHSTYILSQEGNADFPDSFVSSRFQPCAVGLPGATCLHTVYIQFTQNIFIEVKVENNMLDAEIIVDGFSNHIVTEFENEIHLLHDFNFKNQESAVFGWMKDGCLHIMGFKKRGYLIKLCKWSVKIFAHSSKANKLKGLCGDFDGDSSHDLRLRNGDLINPPTRCLLCFANMNVDPTFGRDWEIKHSEVVTNITTGVIVNPVNLCDADNTTLEGYFTTCNNSLDFGNHLSTNARNKILADCAFDQCISASNETIAEEWLTEVQIIVIIQEEEIKNTVDVLVLCDPPCQNGGVCIGTTNKCQCKAGFMGEQCEAKDPNSCTLGEKIYKSGEEWQENCMMFYCKNHKFYTSKMYNGNCGICQVNNDPHFVTYDGVTYDWHGHSTYILSQKGNETCPEVFVSGKFKDCGPNFPFATCVDTVYYQHDKETIITIVKHAGTVGKVSFTTYVNDFQIVLKENLDEGEIQPLRYEEKEYPVFSWNDDDCLYIIGFKTKGFLIKLCSWSLKIYAHPTLSDNLFGLCGDFNDDSNDDLKMRDGFSVSAPSRWFPNKNVNNTFGDDWKVQDCGAEEGVTAPISGNSQIMGNPCDLNPTDDKVGGYENECRKIVYEDERGLLSNIKKERFFEDCVFDMCIVRDEDFTVVNQWMDEIKILIMQEESEIQNTVEYPLGSGKCPAGYKEVASQCLSINIDLTLNWEEAQMHCVTNNGRLVVVQKAEELKFYLNENHGGIRFWVGASDVDEEGVWVWLSGSGVPGIPAFPWHQREPNNLFGNEDCLEYNGNLNGFNDAKCSSELSFICAAITVPQEDGSCIIDEKPYSNGKKWIDGCMTYYCKDGNFYTDNKYHGECGSCTVKNDPHFTTFDGTTYDWHGQSTYTITQEGFLECPELFIHGQFSRCASGLPGATCLHTIYFQPVKNTLITIIKENRIEDSQIYVDGRLQTINAREEGQLQILKDQNNKLKPAFGWIAGGCLHIMAFEQQEFMIKLCDWSLKVFAHPLVANKLHGLCGDWNGNKNGDLKMRNGNIINPPGGNWFSKNVDIAFGNDWEVKNACSETADVTLPAEPHNGTGGCVPTPIEQVEFYNTCKINIEVNETDLDDNKLTGLIESCAFDICIANKTGNETITNIWLTATLLHIQQELEEIGNTIIERDPGACYLDGTLYTQGSEWVENCMSYYCKNRKFYSTNSYNGDCGYCDANNDPHFKTFDGVTYDWHGHSTYVVTQHGSENCPDIFVNSQFTRCTSGMPHATCVHIVYIQPLKGTLIKVVKNKLITDSEVYIDGHSQKVSVTDDRELQILKGPNDKEHPAFAWFFNNCLHIQGFEVSGYLVKICHWSMKVFAHPTSANNLYGLCGDWNREQIGDLKLRNGIIINQPTGFWWAKNVDSAFGNDWEVKGTCPETSDITIGEETNTTVIDNQCGVSEVERNMHHDICNATLTDANNGLDDKKLQTLIDDCAFDRCIANQTGNETLVNVWTIAVKGILEEEEQELVNTGLGSGSCYIAGKGYPSGQEWQENCMRFYCEEGRFYSRRVYNAECGHCTSQNDPHFTTYDNVKFDWHGQSTYVISQKGSMDCPNVFVNSKFKNCASGHRGATCLDIVYYKNENSKSVKIVKDDLNVQNSEISIDGYMQKLTTNDDGELQILKGPNNKEYPVFGLINDGCIHIIGFDNSGFLIKLCKWDLTVYAHPMLKYNLYGLCGDWDNSVEGDLKLRNGVLIPPPRTGGRGIFSLFQAVNKNVDNRYGTDWQVIMCNTLSGDPTGSEEIPDNSCDVQEHDLEEYEDDCKMIVNDPNKNLDLDDNTLQDIIVDCIFDHCIATKTGNSTLIADWLDESGGIVDQKQEEKKNTMVSGSCFMSGNVYSSGTEWTDNCMTYYCEQGKFYSTNKYKSQCGSCTVANDPHFTTYDGVLFDWHGHSTYVISQQSTQACPDVFVNSQFADCAVGHRGATCLHTIYFQPIIGTTIKIVKDDYVQNSKIYVNGNLQKLYVKNNGELQVLKGANNTKHPAFGWINNNCIYFTGFNITGYMIKLCSWTLKIYAHPSQKNQLFGLCGDWNTNKVGDLKLRNGNIITAPSGGIFGSPQVNQLFGQDWEVGMQCPENTDNETSTVLVEGTVCNASEADQNKYLKTCKLKLTPLQIHLEMEKLNGLIGGCAFDQCIAAQTGNEILQREWLNQCIGIVREEEEEIKNTVDSGLCYIDEQSYENGMEWKEGCISYYCQDGKFYSHDVYNGDCGHCSAKNDPHFKTYDGTTYDWHGHNTYVLSQKGSEKCPKEYVNSKFKRCTPGFGGATCLEEIYFQPLEGVEIKIIKDNQIKFSKVYVNGFEQVIAVKSERELQILKGPNNKEVPVFGWFIGDCIHMIGFNTTGFMIKLCGWYLNVYAHKSLKSKLYGLCGDWDGRPSEDLKLRDNSIINPPSGGFLFWAKKNVDQDFGKDWEIKTSCPSQSGTIENINDDTTNTACTASDEQLEKYLKTCRAKIEGSTSKLQKKLLDPLIEDCAFDRCIATQSDDESLLRKWLDLAEGVVHHIEIEDDNTDGGTCQDGFERVGTQCFYFGTPDKGDEVMLISWKDAFYQCKDMGGRLAVIKDYTIFKEYMKKNYGNYNFWIGLSDREVEGEFRWVDGGELQADFPWARTQPDNWYRESPYHGEDCVHISSYYGYEYNDVKCIAQLNYICENKEGVSTLPESRKLTIVRRIHEELISWSSKCILIIICNKPNVEYILFIAEDKDGKESLVYIDKERHTSDNQILELCDLYEGAYNHGGDHGGLIYLLPRDGLKADLNQFKIWTDTDATLTAAALSNEVEETDLIVTNLWNKVKC